MDEQRSAVQWDWTPDIWEWTPERGRWSPEYGRPKDCVFLSLSTDTLRPREAYDYWRETVFYDFEADTPTPVQRDGFQARAAALIAPRGDVYWYQSDPVSGRRRQNHCRREERGLVNLGLVLAGERCHEQDGDRALRSGPGELLFYDPAHPSRVAWGPHQGLHLSLDRDAVCQALGGDPPPPSELIQTLHHSSLFPFLHDQLRLLARHGATLDIKHQSLILDQIIDLALATLNTIGRRPEKERPALLFALARQLIHRHLGDPDLDASTLAQRLSCSRATLYRAFAAQDLSVAGYLREARLRRVRRLLRGAPAHQTIADIAARCGFVDSTSFSRLFRRRFGVRPRDLRQRHRLR